MPIRMLRVAAPAALLLAAGAPAAAHITLETATAPAGSYYKAVFRVGHGCKGSPTTSIRVRVPDGVASVKPQPKPGWQVEIVKDEGHNHGAKVTEVVWTGRLLDAHYDEFAVRMKLPDMPGTALLFPVLQVCEQGEQPWVEPAEPGHMAGHGGRPAPVLRLIAKP